MQYRVMSVLVYVPEHPVWLRVLAKQSNNWADSEMMVRSLNGHSAVGHMCAKWALQLQSMTQPMKAPCNNNSSKACFWHTLLLLQLK